VVYLAAAAYAIYDEFKHGAGGWINLRGMGVVIATAPSQLTFGLLFERLGAPRVNYSQPGLADYGQIAFHVAVTAAFVYLLGCGIEWAFRRITAPG